MGNVLGLSTTVPTQSGGTATENEAFCYDALSRLVWAGNTGTPSGGDHCMSAPSSSGMGGYLQSYSYDSLDRLTSGPAGSSTYGDSTHVHAATGISTVPNAYAAYDAMGNMTCRNTDTTSTHTCAGSSPTGALKSNDSRGQLAAWSAPSGTVGSAHYLYDNEGNRVLTSSSNASSTTDTIYFDGYTETVLSGGTTTTTKYYSANGTRIAVRIGGATLDSLLSDPLGSNSVALNNTGQVIGLEHYSPYGTVDYSWGTMPTSYNYTGQQLDSQTGLLYYDFRYYDPVSDRFVRADTKQNNTNGMDSYAYAGDNPETRNDPTGHRAIGYNPSHNNAALTTDDIVTYVCLLSVQCDEALTAYNRSVAWQAFLNDVAMGITIGEIGAGIFDALTTGDPSEFEAASQQLGEEAVTSAETDLLNDEAQTLESGACSFTSETPVETDKGKEPIGRLRAGEKVLAYNAQTHKTELEPILHVWIHQDDDLVDLTLMSLAQAGDGKSSQRERTNEVIHTNKKHPFLTTEKGFLPAGQIKVGMHVRRADGSIGIVTGWRLVPGTATMYNLEVAQDHTFTVGAKEWIVHNCTAGPYDEAILKAYGSKNPGTQLEGEMALFARMEGYEITSFRTRVNGPTGTVGDIDAETPGAILEAKAGKTWDSDNAKQIEKLQGVGPDGNLINPTGKPVIVYAPNMPPDKVAQIQTTGAFVATNEEQLLVLLWLTNH